jgi:hypothetical protein
MPIDDFIDALFCCPPMDRVFNPYRDYDESLDKDCHAPRQRLEQLRSYLTRRENPYFALVAEAPGYQGARFTGIAMTCERTLLGRKHQIDPRDICDPAGRTSQVRADQFKSVNMFGHCEPTATTVWRCLADLEVHPTNFVLWNTFPFHPQGAKGPLSNRTPTDVEVSATQHILTMFLSLFRVEMKVIAIGNIAAKQLGTISGYQVRHPSYGGAPEFRSGIAEAVTSTLAARPGSNAGSGRQ